MTRLNVGNIRHPDATTDSITLTSGGDTQITGALGLGGATYGSSGQVLTSAGSGSTPTWTTISASNLSESTVVSLSTQTEVDFDLSTLSPMPKRITLVLQRLSVSGNNAPLFQIGDSGGVETSGYSTVDAVQYAGGSSNFTTGQRTNGWRIDWGGDTMEASGHFTLTNVPSTNWWVGTGNFEVHQGTGWYVWSFTGGAHELDGAIQTLRLTTSGSDTLDAGRAFLQYEV